MLLTSCRRSVEVASVMRLVTPTNRTTSGPNLAVNRDQLTVSYDCDYDDGSVATGEIEFTEVIAFRFWDESSSPAENVLEATEIREQQESEYLRLVVGRWNEAVGWQQWQKERGGPDRFRHFTAFFDDAGSLDVVSARCDIKR